jgi:hypothetical protein
MTSTASTYFCRSFPPLRRLHDAVNLFCHVFMMLINCYMQGIQNEFGIVEALVRTVHYMTGSFRCFETSQLSQMEFDGFAVSGVIVALM